MKRSRNDLSLERKYEIVAFAESHPAMKNVHFAQKFNIKPQTMSDLLKNKEKIKEKYTSISDFTAGKTKRVKVSKFENTSTALTHWFTGMRTNKPGIPISGEVLRQKATQFARQLDELAQDKEIDMNWVNRWKNNNEVTRKKMAGESADVTDNSIEHWKQILKIILEKYSPENIYNCDECGLFWLLTPDKTLAFKKEKVHGGKKSKQRITILNTASMTGEKEPLLVIGKFAKPRCFKNVTLPVKYRANKKAWMTGEIFTEYVTTLDRSMGHQRRKIALVLDNCTAHPKVNGLKNVELFFLPPNTTSRTQPLDAGIIYAMKQIYRRKLVEQMLLSLDQFSISKKCSS